MAVLAESSPLRGLGKLNPFARERSARPTILYQQEPAPGAAQPLASPEPNNNNGVHPDNHAQGNAYPEPPPTPTSDQARMNLPTLSAAAREFDDAMTQEVAHLRKNKIERRRSRTQRIAAAIGGWLGSAYTTAQNIFAGPAVGAAIGGGITYAKNTLGRIFQGETEGAANLLARRYQQKKRRALMRFFDGPTFVGRVMTLDNPDEHIQLTPQQVRRMGDEPLKHRLNQAYEMHTFHGDIHDSSNDIPDFGKDEEKANILERAGLMFGVLYDEILRRRLDIAEIKMKLKTYLINKERERWHRANLWNSVESMWPAALTALAWDAFSGKTAQIYSDAAQSVKQWVETAASNVAAGVRSAGDWVGARFGELKVTVENFFTTPGTTPPPPNGAPVTPPVPDGSQFISPDLLPPVDPSSLQPFSDSLAQQIQAQHPNLTVGDAFDPYPYDGRDVLSHRVVAEPANPLEAVRNAFHGVRDTLSKWFTGHFTQGRIPV